ncbi:patatin [Rhizophagus irregularis DAOM 181602=DAOM 197198]|nr:patatin [Rhizophagus irregularis DAOM 181602=DAOM 197198]
MMKNGMDFLAKKFENFSEKPERIDTYRTESRLFIDAVLRNIGLTSNEEEENKENIHEAVEKELSEIKDILEDKVTEFFRNTFEKFNNVPKSFEDYKNIVAYEIILRKIADNPINESLIYLENSQTKDTTSKDQKSKINKENKQQMISSLEKLKSLASKAAYSIRLAFIYHFLNSPNKKEILFSNTVFTEEEINKRFRDIALYFHSDKTSRPNTPTWLQEKHRNLGDELFNFTLKFKESLLEDLEGISQNEGYLTFHEKKANDLWKIAIDYRNAAKGQWDKLKVLNKDDVEKLSPDELKIVGIDNGILAYQEYRAACRIADKSKQLKKQVQLRGNMALCLYISNKFIEAQLYALSAIQLQLRNSQNVTQQDFIETKKIFDKVKGGGPTMDTTEGNTVNAKETTKLETEIKLKDKSDNTMALVRTVDQGISFFERKTIQESINNDMANISVGLMLKADQSLVRYQVPAEVILHAKERVVKHKIVGGAAMGGAMAVGTTISVTAGLHIYEAVAIIGVTSVGGPFALVSGLLALGLGIWAGVTLWKRGNRLREVPEIRENLNKIMIETIGAYNKGEYQEVIKALSEEYNKKTKDSLLKLTKREDFINTDHIIETLLYYGFRSDGIAYLLNLLGEVLSSGKVELNGMTKKDLKALATSVFNGALSEKLVDDAKKLDGRIRELRKGHIVSTFNKFKDSVLLKEYSDMAKEYKDDAEEMPFISRLEEMRNITRINRAIFDILDAGKEEIKRAIETIKEVQNSIDNNYQFVNSAKWRYEVLEDLLWVINGEESPTESSEESSEESPKLSLITYIDDKYINYLNQQLKQASSTQERFRLFNAIATCYVQLAEKEDNNRLNGLCYWRSAQKNYEEAREKDPENLDAALGFAKCLLKLSKYTQVIQLLNVCPNLTSLSEYWYFRSIAYQKKADYKNAKENIIEALNLDNKNKLADKQRLLLKKLSEKNIIEWRINRYKKEKNDIDDVDYFKSSHSKESPTYNILSIDGGGVCGILPALWLSEIEYRTHRPISHLFNMITGISAGGIIAAGLSVPFWEIHLDSKKNPYYECSDKPKFSASDLLDIYQNQAKNLFITTNNNNSQSFFKPKHTEQDRSSLFSEHFGRVRLNQALTELVIPAVDVTTSNLTQTHFFTRYDDRSDDSKDDTFFDTLMATTAAPTLFPPYEIKGRGLFSGEALHLNNPTIAAYEEAIRYNAPKEKISVLSLGTGSYVPDPLNPDLYRDSLFWARNLHKIVLPQHEGNIDSLMYSLLGNRHQRWQVWLEEPIELDDCKSTSYLLELGHQYIEELDSSDDNPINKLVESFEK